MASGDTASGDTYSGVPEVVNSFNSAYNDHQIKYTDKPTAC